MSVQLEMFSEPKPVTLQSGWHELFGHHASEMPEAVKRRRWATWLKLSRRGEDGRDAARYWQSTEACEDCRHQRGYWCRLVGLPCSVNPLLTMRRNMIGMACAGTGYESPDGAPREIDPAFGF